MLRLPLYPGGKPRSAAVEQAEPSEVTRACDRCDLHEGVRTVCVGDEGEPGGLLLVGESPGRVEDALARPFSGKSGQYLRQIVAKFWNGPVAYSNAVRCFGYDTLVSAFGIERAYRRWYSGPMIRITAGLGGRRVLTGTPNHPVLTARGWVVLNELQEGDYLVDGSFAERVGLGDPNVDRRPTKFGELFDSLAQSWIGKRRGYTHVDFHGDWGDGEVDVVGSNWKLDRK